MVPSNCWVQGRNLAAKTIENETISLGFVRVLPELNIANLRLEIEAQLDQSGMAQDEDTHVPKNFIFIRNVGRHFAMVSTIQTSFNGNLELGMDRALKYVFYWVKEKN